ncbi:ATP-dependent zinc metalloprotease FtsH [Gossypium australe]|uniref:ATP-dependent zinc metalloprotease FtsH n=1 Tax=Gossypium australe TaxID=47621 RepID=A0A5B6WHA6_9ROSI|nr:ATP-dependent zinc metalloprotease FtsH [Gossypium australe]
MSTRGRGRGTRGYARGRGAEAGSSESGHVPECEVPALPVANVGSQDQTGRDDALSQAMLRVLEIASTGSAACGSISKRLKSNGVFRRHFWCSPECS